MTGRGFPRAGGGAVVQRAGSTLLAAVLALSVAACGAAGPSRHAAGPSHQAAGPSHQAAGPTHKSSKGATHHLSTTAVPTGRAPLLGSTAGAYSCTAPQRVPTVQGTPDVTAVPAIRAISLRPASGGLQVIYDFSSPVAPAPEGVYLSWTISLYRHRSDAGKSTRAIELQVEDRGKGWEPTGWSILASTYATSSPVAGQVSMNTGRTRLTTFFPAGFADLTPPFYWFATEEEYRAYMPEASKVDHQNFSVNGAITIDCPAGVRAGPYSLPDGSKLLGT